MKTFNKWSCCLAVIFVLSMLFLIANPVSAANASEKKNAGDTSGSVTQAAQQSQNSLEQGVGDPQGPPDNPGPGCYEKIDGKDAGTYQYFKHGHPEGPTKWRYRYAGPECPYGK